MSAHPDAVHETVFERLAALEHRLSNMIKFGTVASADAETHRIVGNIGDTDAPLLTPAIPHSQIAGGRKTHSMPTVGQQMVFFSKDGEFEQGFALPLTWSNANPSPSTDPEAHVDVVGGCTVTYKGGVCTIEADTLLFKAGGVTYRFDGVGFVQMGGLQTHDGRNVGKTHRHGGVQPGGSLTGEPQS